MTRPRTWLVLVVGSALLWSLAAAGAGPALSGPESRTLPASRYPTPALIERDVRAGRLDRATADRYLAYSLVDHARVPAAYRSSAPFHGTTLLLELRERMRAMPAGPARRELEALLVPDPGSFCDALSPSPLADQVISDHFYIEYDAAVVGGASGLTIDDYVDSLEHSWRTEVTRFKWWDPPVSATPPPEGKYHVRIEPAMAPVLYGFVSTLGKYTGEVGDNPHSPWDDVDAQATCMGLNNDYTGFPGGPREALDATTAHEFNHSIQFGVGAITGSNAPDSIFIEGGATWMEDEAYDSANDNYNYLWPDFNDDMGEHEGSVYSYWLTFRGLTERYGASVPGGGENVMQRFWELVSKGEVLGMDALNQALEERGTTLARAYQAYAVAAKFNRACGPGYRYPYCFQEGPAYVNGDPPQEGAGPTAPHGTIAAVGGSFMGSIPDNYSLNWIVVPNVADFYGVRVTNTSAGGLLTATLACDTGTRIRIHHLGTRLDAGELGSRRFRDLDECEQAVVVITNVLQTGADPTSSTSRTFTVQTFTPGAAR